MCVDKLFESVSKPKTPKLTQPPAPPAPPDAPDWLAMITNWGEALPRLLAPKAPIRLEPDKAKFAETAKRAQRTNTDAMTRSRTGSGSKGRLKGKKSLRIKYSG